MYEIDTTRAYVLECNNEGEANRSYRILSEDYGVIRARATSVRKEQSKLKYFLQKLSHINLEAIHSRRGYQITGGQLLESPTDTYSFAELGVLDRIGALILRLSHTDDHDTVLYEIFHRITQNLTLQDTKHLAVLELWGTALVLQELGYFNTSFSPDIHPEIFQKSLLTNVDIEQLGAQQKPLDRYVQDCIKQTML